jgi:hypothetical protein
MLLIALCFRWSNQCTLLNIYYYGYMTHPLLHLLARPCAFLCARSLGGHRGAPQPCECALLRQQQTDRREGKMSRWSGSRLLKQAQTAESTTPKEAPKTGTQNSSKLSFKVGAATVAQNWCKCVHFVTVVTILNLSAHGADQVFLAETVPS